MSTYVGLDIPKLKQNVIEYWAEDSRMTGPVKVISFANFTKYYGVKPQTALGRVFPVRGCVVSAKFVLGRPLKLAEQILGLHPGDLSGGAVLLRLGRTPEATDFDLTGGYTNVAAYAGYPVGLGSNQWILKNDIAATVVKVAKASETL